MENTFVLGISGSPRKNGNSETLLDWTLEAATEEGARVEKIRVCDLKFQPCLECGACNTTGVCIQNDDMQQVFPRFLSADSIVIATPMFFMNMPAHLKGFIDRFQCLWSKKYLLKQPLREDKKPHIGYTLAIGGTKGASLFNGLNLLLKCFFPIVDVEFNENNSLYYRSVDEKGAIEVHPTAKNDSKALGAIIAKRAER